MNKTCILFVDDEANVLDGLRRLLRKQRDVWEMVFVQSGPQALAQLEAAPFDVLVTDMQMPGMSGAQLLEIVQARYPEVARIILSGHVDEAHATRVLKLAHQFLSKPADAETLQEAIASVHQARQSIPSTRARSLAASVGALPSPPELHQKITQIAASDEVSAREIASLVSRDPAITAKLLQLVNSSFFGLGRRVSSIEHAVALLGLVRIKSLILSAQILDQFPLARPIAGFSINRLLRRAALTAQLARVISQAEEQAGDRPDQAFAAGLLHDVGLLILAARNPEGLTAALGHVQRQHVPLCAAERDLLDTTHAEVGACLLELWGLPARIVEGVYLHHDPSQSSFDGVSALTAVHAAAGLLPVGTPQGTLPEEETPFAVTLDTAYLARIGRSARVDEWKQLVAEVLGNLEPQTA